MPTEAENIQFLYLVLTYDNNPTIDWDAIGHVLNLNKGAVTKRWSRLKKAIDQGETPSASAYGFLWLCVKHSTRANAPNWEAIASKCDTTAGAASKRYSRMKKAFEENVTAPNTLPSSPVKNTPVKPKSTPKSAVKKGTKAAENDAASPSVKRKRSTVNTPALTADADEKFKPEPDEEDDEELFDVKPKRVKSKSTTKIIPKPKRKTVVKKEVSADEEGDVFYDAEEEAKQDAEDITHER
ncbi:hypothetical protein ACJQWK_08954 [Exserohilum turcicum]|uniref:Myb-like DNA-binding domain-containing protein n=1 Tax=Exserohilum turcicum (strain 28A) TaxID=671987 RepID=R0KBX8_EXST2|nr:uncharacterized protein SETTUDRAFT_31212 [Exserohilum turcica Et28A]EOA86904.1 hypothetical protein SETTUDRAFT_31212 [Exserohilum turcica Et28A]